MWAKKVVESNRPSMIRSYTECTRFATHYGWYQAGNKRARHCRKGRNSVVWVILFDPTVEDVEVVDEELSE